MDTLVGVSSALIQVSENMVREFRDSQCHMRQLQEEMVPIAKDIEQVLEVADRNSLSGIQLAESMAGSASIPGMHSDEASPLL